MTDDPARTTDRPIVAVVLAGGTGTRLYPASRSDRPKQFQSFGGDDSLLARTVDRLGFADDVLVLTRPAFAEEAADHAPSATVVTEPDGKDTGPALAYGTAVARERVRAGEVVADDDGGGVGDDARGIVDDDARSGVDDDDATEPVVLAVPSDHHVGEAEHSEASERASGAERPASDDAFATTMRQAASVAADTGSLVTVGVEPDRPATGYGYIAPGTERDGYAAVERFHEKPDGDTAAEYVADGALWNAGLFAWTPSAFRSAARDTPLAGLVAALESAASDGIDAVRTAAAAAYEDVDPVSVDYAVLERADDVAVVPATFPWDDLGSWDAIARVHEADADGNVALTDALALDAADNVVAGDKHVSLVGVEGLAVVAVDDRVLVVPKAQAQRVREVVDRLRADDAF